MHEEREQAVIVERREGPYGEVVLRRRGERFEIIENGCFLMDTSDGRSERLLVRAALDALEGAGALAPGRDGRSVLIGGLGVGFSLAEAAAEPRWGRIAVVERERAVIDWHRTTRLREAQSAGGGGRATDGHLAPFSERALDDPRVGIVEADLVRHVHEAGPAYDALCLDIDNGPDWTVTDSNDSLYSPEGLAACRRRLAPGGVLAVWSAQPSPVFEDALRAAGFTQVRTIAVSVPRGVPDVVHICVRPA